jgi:hypothetical protein
LFFGGLASWGGWWVSQLLLILLSLFRFLVLSFSPRVASFSLPYSFSLRVASSSYSLRSFFNTLNPNSHHLTEITSSFASLLTSVKDRLTSKLTLYASLSTRCADRMEEIEEKGKELAGIRKEMEATAGGVVGRAVSDGANGREKSADVGGRERGSRGGTADVGGVGEGGEGSA